MKVKYSEYKNKIEAVSTLYVIEHKKGAYDKSAKTIEITFDEKYKDLFDYLTDEQILKICEIVTRRDDSNMKYWLLQDIEIFKTLNEEQKQKAVELIIAENHAGDMAIQSTYGMLKKLGFEDPKAKYNEIFKK